MFGAGHILDMIKRLNYNKSQRPSKLSIFDKENSNKINFTEKNKLVFKKVPEKELIEIKNRIRNRAKKRQRRDMIFYGILLLIGLLIIIRSMLLLI